MTALSDMDGVNFTRLLGEDTQNVWLPVPVSARRSPRSNQELSLSRCLANVLVVLGADGVCCGLHVRRLGRHEGERVDHLH